MNSNKSVRVLRHLTSVPPDGTRLVGGPRMYVPTGRTPALRLSYLAYGPVPLDVASLARMIRHPNNSGVRYLIDSNMFIGDTDNEIWDALLEGAGRLIVPKPVQQELIPWIRSPRRNFRVHKEIVSAINQSDKSRVKLGELPRDETTEAKAFTYYVELLGFRKRIAPYATSCLCKILGRVPTPQELSNFLKDNFGIRGQLLARKGRDAKTPEHLLNDEQIVMLAIFEAIYGGHEVAIFTRDEDVIDQFYKACWLVDTHYRSMLLASRFASAPWQFNSRRVSNGMHIADAFNGEVLLVRLPSDHLCELLPANWTSISVHCFLIRDTLTHLSFHAERELQLLFFVKAATSGLSTNEFPGRNCHIFTPCRPINEGGPWAVIGFDKNIRAENSRNALSVVDANLSVMSNERFQTVRPVDSTRLILPTWIDN